MNRGRFIWVPTDKLLDRIDELEDEISGLKKLLARLEWSGTKNDDGAFCPICWKSPEKGHTSDCALGRELHNVVP